MPLVVRKIEYNKWMQNKILEGEEPSADAITNCMRTRQNKLSVWSIKDEEELEDAVLAIVAQFDHLDSIDVLSIDRSLLEQNGLLLEKTPGITPYNNFTEKHLDIANLNYISLGFMANTVIKSIKQNRRKRFTSRKLIEMLTDAVCEGKISLSDLKPDIQKKISQN